MAFTALSSLSLPYSFALGGLGIVAIFWLLRFPRLSLGLLFLSVISGQLLRLPLPGQGGGLLLSDLAITVVLLTAVLNVFLPNKLRPTSLRYLSAQPGFLIFWLVLPFVCWSFFSLVVNFSDLGLNNTAIALSYWLRLSANLLLLPALILLLQDEHLYRFSWYGFNISAMVLAVLGFLQLVLFPDLSLLVRSGWDPHQSRLVSTWLDPNFIGLFFVMALPLDLLWKKKIYRLLGLAVFVVAIMTTQSRGAFIAAGLALLLMSPLLVYYQVASRQRGRIVFVISVLGLLLVAAIVFAWLLGPRLTGLLSSDPTVDLRLVSLATGWQVAVDHYLVGVGYNAYQFATGASASDYAIHSRAGTDNSFLTLWATTGLVGLVLFFIPWLYLLHVFWARFSTGRNLPSLLGIYVIIVLLIHAQFINSLLYTHILISACVILPLIYHRP